ncbi:MAG TPA: HRDC domain-containing protein [Phycisphaerae bacterium]|nr:HRDC domain-containing protein [Phycisphaerae bacterium]
MTDGPHDRVITSQAGLAELCASVSAVGRFAFDTEFVGEDSYQPEVCLIQVATDEFQAIIDPLAGLDARPFWELVADPTVETIVHAGSEDLTLCWKFLGRPPSAVIDLQVAAGFIGLGYPTALSRLARETIGAKLHKSQTLTDWRRRPLNDEQLAYAVEDVIHLPPMYHHMRGRLETRGRWAWVIEECSAMCAPAVFEAAGPRQLRRLRGLAGLNRQELAVADALLDERERLAKRYNRPPRTVLRDHLLVELARRGWTDPSRMRTLRGMNLSNADLEKLAAAISTAKSSPPELWPTAKDEDQDRDEDAIITLLSAVLRDHCKHHGVAYGLLSNKEELRATVRSYVAPTETDAVTPLRIGWRGEFIGRLLERLLTGQAAVRIALAGPKARLTIE